MNESIQVRLCIVGDDNIGKTCILMSGIHNKYPTDYIPTVFEFDDIVNAQGKQIHLKLSDTVQRQDNTRMRAFFYPKCDIFLIAFSVIQPQSFEKAINVWYPQLQIDPSNVNVPKIFVGNKIDQRDIEIIQNKHNKKDPISYVTAKNIIEKQFKCKYMECSALTQQGIKQLFTEAIRTVLENKGRQFGNNHNDHRCSLI